MHAKQGWFRSIRAVVIALALVFASFLPNVTAGVAAAGQARLRLVDQSESFSFFTCSNQPEDADNCFDFYVNAVKVSSLDYSGDNVQSAITLPAGNVRIQAVRYGASPSAGVLAETKTYLESGKSYTAVLRGTGPDGFTIIRDRIPTIAAGQVSIKFANFATSLVGVDVYIDGKRVLRDLNYRAHSSYFTLPAGNHVIQIAPTGASSLKTIVEPDYPLAPGSVNTAFISGFVGTERIPFGASRAIDQ